MKSTIALLLTLFMAIAFAPSSSAQGASIAGTYTIKTADGNPVDPDYVYEVTYVAVPGFSGLYAAYVTRDRIEDPDEEDTGKEVVAGEQSFVWATGPGTFAWENARGTLGAMELLPGGDLISVVLTGPHQGTVRRFEKATSAEEDD